MGRLILIVLILALPAAGASAAEPGSNVSLGIMGTGGIYDTFSRGGGNTMNWNPGPGYGGGFIFEKMFSNRLGVQSGLLYSEYSITTSETRIDSSSGTPTPVKFTYDLKSRGIGMPLYLVTSFNSASVSLNLLAGFSLFHLLDSKVTWSRQGASGTSDIIIDINENQAAVSGGIMIRFRVGQYTDLFIGGLADFNLLNLFSDNAHNDESIYHLYSYRGVAGIMMRTNLFPLRDR